MRSRRAPATQDSVDLGGILCWLQREQRQSVRLRFDAAGKLTAHCPIHLPIPILMELLQERLPWILAQRQRIQSQALGQGSRVPYLGGLLTLQILEAGGPTLNRSGNTLWMTGKLSPEQRQRLLQRWLRQELKALLQGLLAHWQARLQVPVTHWGIRQMRTRWGSCNVVKKRLSFASRLIAEPHSSIEYVVVHELMHLREPGHTPRFYALVEQCLPDWQERERDLGRRKRKSPQKKGASQ